MYKNGGYAGDDRMCDLVCDRYAVLQVMSRFGIALGFGDKTIAEVCAESRVDAATFLAVVNMLMNFGNGAELAGEVSVRSLTDYLHNSHGYFLDFRLPAIRRKLIEAVDCALSDVSFAIMRFFDEYAAEVQRHMSYEEQTVFPYVESLLSGEKNTAYSIDIFRRQHDQIDIKLRELKNIIIKYYPSGSSNELNGVLFDIFNCEHELASHNAVEDELFIPAVERLAAAGYRQYEISNFARAGFQSRHNLKYWMGRPYIGFGPGAHSDFGGRRYSFIRDLEGYIAAVLEGGTVIDESDLIPQRERGGEYLMLRLRTTRGIEEWEYRREFFMNFDPIEQKLEEYERQGWAERHDRRWNLTAKGFLVSNQLIGELLSIQEEATLEKTLPRLKQGRPEEG